MKHGAGIYKVAKQLRCSADEILDYSSNINTYNPNVNITLTNHQLARYGDSSYKGVIKAISNKYKIQKTQISLYNGATSAIFELFKNLKQKDVYLYAPLYGEYEKAASISKKNIVKINRFKELDFIPKKNSIVVFVNPSTPDGKHYNLTKLFKLWKKQNCTIILDESFIEFQKLKSLRNQIEVYKKLYIIQSFSKFYSCAGVRIGAIFSDSNNIEKLKTPLWNLSTFDVEFLSKRLKDKSFEKISRTLHKKHKDELLKILKKSNLFSKIYKSDSNFFLTKSKHSRKIFIHLLQNKILVRTCGSFDSLSNDYLRFAVKDSNANKQLKQSLKTINIK